MERKLSRLHEGVCNPYAHLIETESKCARVFASGDSSRPHFAVLQTVRNEPLRSRCGKLVKGFHSLRTIYTYEVLAFFLLLFGFNKKIGIAGLVENGVVIPRILASDLLNRMNIEPLDSGSESSYGALARILSMVLYSHHDNRIKFVMRERAVVSWLARGRRSG